MAATSNYAVVSNGLPGFIVTCGQVFKLCMYWNNYTVI